MIELENITLAHGASAPLLQRQSCVIPSGSLTALTGCNGAGKSTLLRCISGFERPAEGRVLLGSERMDSGRMSVQDLAKCVAVVNTRRVQVPHLSCRELVELGRAPHTGLFGNLSPEDHVIVSRALEAVGMTRLATRQVDTLSDGEHQRLMLARAIAQDTPVVLLDEPTGFLDVPNRRAVTQLLSSLAHTQGKTIIYSTHEIALALENADMILHIAPPRLWLLPPDEIKHLPEFAPLM